MDKRDFEAFIEKGAAKLELKYKHKKTFPSAVTITHNNTTKQIDTTTNKNYRGDSDMFADQLAQKATHPFADNINAVVSSGMYTFRNECLRLSNQGKRQIATYLMGDSIYYDVGTTVFDFDEMEKYQHTRNIPQRMKHEICERVRAKIQEELQRENFKNISVKESVYVYSKKSIKRKCIEISASW